MSRSVSPSFAVVVICVVAFVPTLQKLQSTIEAFNDPNVSGSASGSGTATTAPGGLTDCDCLTAMVRRKGELALTPAASRLLSEVHQLTKEKRKPNARGWYALCGQTAEKKQQPCAADQVQSFMTKEFPLAHPEGGVATCAPFIELTSTQLASTKAFARALMDTQSRSGRCVSILGFNADVAHQDVTASIKGLLEEGTVAGQSIFGEGDQRKTSSIALVVSGSLKYDRVRSMLTELPIAA